MLSRVPVNELLDKMNNEYAGLYFHVDDVLTDEQYAENLARLFVNWIEALEGQKEENKQGENDMKENYIKEYIRLYKVTSNMKDFEKESYKLADVQNEINSKIITEHGESVFNTLEQFVKHSDNIRFNTEEELDAICERFLNS